MALFAVGSAFGDEPAKSAPEEKPQLTANWSAETLSSGARQLLVYSEKELKSVQYKFEGVVNDFEALTVAKPTDGRFIYFTSAYVPATEGQKFLVRAVRADGSRITHRVTVGKDAALDVAVYKIESKEAVQADTKAVVAAPVGVPAAVGLSATEQAMIEAANAFRARNGKGALQVSPELMKAARDYAASGAFDHGTAGRYAAASGFPGRTTENLARGPMTGAGVIAYWGEPGVGHERQLAGQIKMNGRWIDGGFTHVGVAGVNGNWIIYFGSAR